MSDFGDARRQKFNDSFNELLGGKIGKTRKNYSSKQFDNRISLEMAAYAAGLSKKAPKIAGAKKKTTTTTPVEQTVLDDQVTSLASSAEGVKIPDNKSLWDKIKGAPAGLLDATPDAIKSPLLTGLDLLARPGNTVTNAVFRGAEALKDGEPIYSVLDDVGYGAKQGLLGREHHGIGDVEEMADTSHDTPMWLKRMIGFAGDVAFDPTTYMSIGATTLAKNASKGVAKQTGKEAVEATVKKAVREALEPTVINKTRKIIKDAKGVITGNVGHVDQVVSDVLNKVDKVIYEVNGGAQRGKVIGGTESYRTLAQETAEGFIAGCCRT